MNKDVAVIIATYGDEVKWKERAAAAVQSACQQTILPKDIIRSHDETLAIARNKAAQETDADWLIFLDADDTLDPLYIEEMLKVHGHIRQPSTLGVYADGTTDDEPVLIPSKNLVDGNFLIIGCMVSKTLFLRVGGFAELPCFEDWDLWIRCALDGALITPAPKAIYRVSVSDTGRNHSLSESDRDRILWSIRKKYNPWRSQLAF